MIKELIYIKKEICEIQIPAPIHTNRYDPKYYSIISNGCRFSIRFNIINGERFDKKFYVFLFIGDDFPRLSYKKKLLVLHKYKFSKVYTIKNDVLLCYYFKRGVLFENQYIRDDNKEILSIKRHFKLLKLKLDITPLSADRV